MKACELFSRMPEETGREIISWFRDSERMMYRGAIASLAPLRKVRPEFISRKSGPEQIQWILDQLRRRNAEEIGENLLQIWLMKARSAMLVTFLDGVGVAHDGKGGIDGDIPPSFDPEAVRGAVGKLLGEYPAAEVAIYLHLFQLQQPGGWAEITACLENDPRLHLQEAPAA